VGAQAEYVIVDFDAFDEWFEEDERNLGHPRDPFHRIEIVHSSRSVRVERDGELLAASARPYLLLEALLPASEPSRHPVVAALARRFESTIAL
jgi:hypothetical protein